MFVLDLCLKGENKGKGRSLADRTVSPDVAAVAADKLLCQSEANAASATFSIP